MVGVLNIPNVISISTSFIVGLKAFAKSNCNIIISAGQSIKSENYNADLYHEGTNGKVDIDNRGNPVIQSLPPRAHLFNSTSLTGSKEMNFVLEFNPTLQMSSSIFGKPVAEIVIISNYIISRQKHKLGMYLKL